MSGAYPSDQGLYRREYEHDNCGIGFVANIKGRKSHDIVARGLEVLKRMEHRGAESADNKTGDGAGILTQLPDAFFREVVEGLPSEGAYGAGLVFLPRKDDELKKCISILEDTVKEEGLGLVAWRDVPVVTDAIGDIARSAEPVIKQVFIKAAPGMNPTLLERKLYIVRKLAERRVRESGIEQRKSFHMPSLSSRTIVYKGMLMPDQVDAYYKDLLDERFTSAIALVHSRFSTNTFPSWDLAQPFRMVAHNGEINTIKGNRFWMQARESAFVSELFGDEISKILPVIEPDKSDSASFDNALEMLVATGRPLPHVLMMMVPESWNDKNPIPDDLKYFYEFHSTFMEPWDGPASMVFCDGRYVGGTLDRNGLRPSRYVITHDDMIVMGSEVGVQTFEPEEVKAKGRLMPGKLLLVDTLEGRIIPDEEIKKQIAYSKPYNEWVQKYRVPLDTIPVPEKTPAVPSGDELLMMQLQCGYTREDVDETMKPMIETGQEPTSSMGIDTPLAVFSDRPQPLYNYFKQCFAQVTNPAIDPIREELVMTLTSYIGPQRNLLQETPEHCNVIKTLRPVLFDRDLARIREWNNPAFKTITLDATFDVAGGRTAFARRVKDLCAEAEAEFDKGCTILVLSDRKMSADRAPLPALLACGAVHHHLIRVKKRTRVGLAIETAEAREVMHFALLFGYGADVINPWGALATVDDLYAKGYFSEIKKAEKAQDNFVKAIEKGLLKVLSKMGTSTLRSYRAAQIFEAVGLGSEVIDLCFTGTPSRIGGIGLEEIGEEAIRKHEAAWNKGSQMLQSEGNFRYRKGGERHAWNPDSVRLLQWAVRSGSYERYREFADMSNNLNRNPHVIRGLFDFKKCTPIPIEQVEPAENIYKRLTTGAMSLGSLSREVHETIATAMNALGGRSNSGEGGENAERFERKADGSFSRSSVKQVASGRFGVTSHYLANADEIQIKVCQGAKPGEGGQLPGHKVDQFVASIRYSTPGVTLISPPPHHDIYSIEDLAQLIFDLKNANPQARISVKLVSETGVGTVAAGVAKAHADNIVISGFDGGTGASPLSSIRHAGLPWEIGISETHQTLVLNGLRGRVKLMTDGQLKTGRDVVIAAMLGAEEFAFGTSALITMGCVMMRKCHMNTCPVGVATQDPTLRSRFAGRPEYLMNFMKFLTQDIREIMASLGVSKFEDLVGRTDLIEVRGIDHWKGSAVNPAALLHKPENWQSVANYCCENQIHKINDIVDRELIQKCAPALERKEAVRFEMPIRNIDRSVGAMLSNEISKRYGVDGLPEDTIKVTFRGNAGQSFGAFCTKGVTFRVEGDTNDYLGKGLCGARLIVVPPAGSTFIADENIIIGNTVLYGATSGEAYINGVAGERFCVRNSGVHAVVEGTGDHCAEYMTGGSVVVLGRVGRNFAAGMSGGVGYVLDTDGKLDYFCNKGMVELTPLTDGEDIDFLKNRIEKHLQFTGSRKAKNILARWDYYLSQFVKVMPLEYKRALQEMKLRETERQLAAVRQEEQLEVRSDG